MNVKTYDLLRFLLSNRNESFTIKELAERFCVSDRSITNYLSDIKSFAAEYDVKDLFTRVNARVKFTGTEEQARNISDYAITADFYQYKLSSAERQFIITLFLLVADDYITLANLEELLFTSKATLLNEMKVVKDTLISSGLSLTQKKQNGYLLDIRESTRRDGIYTLLRALPLSVKELLEKKSRNICAWVAGNELCFELYGKRAQTALSIVEQQFNITMSDDTFDDITVVLVIMLSRCGNCKPLEQEYQLDDENELCMEIATHIVKLLYGVAQSTDDTHEKEILYLSHFLSGKRLRYLEDDKELLPQVDFHIVVKSFLYKLSQAFSVDFLVDDSLQEYLTAHVTAMLTRLKSSETLVNPYKERFLRVYDHEYHIVQSQIHILEEYLNEKLSDDEMVYILMHIVTALKRLGNMKRYPRVIVSCHTGFGTAHFLAENLKNQFKINIVDIASTHQVQLKVFKNPENFTKTCDFIISTAPLLGAPVPWIQVNPMPSPEDIFEIYKMISGFNVSQNKKGENGSTLSGEMLLTNTLETNAGSPIAGGRHGQALLSEILREEDILLDKTAQDWKDAIIMAGEPLLWSNKVGPEYLMSMVNSVLENGPYFVFIPGVALAHANPKYGAKDFGVSFLRLKEPVCFGHKENDPVTFIIALSVIDAKKDIELLLTMMNSLCSADIIHALKTAASPKDVIEAFRRFENGLPPSKKFRNYQGSGL